MFRSLVRVDANSHGILICRFDNASYRLLVLTRLPPWRTCFPSRRASKC